jgi:PAS domain S-box-containing protein
MYLTKEANIIQSQELYNYINDVYFTCKADESHTIITFQVGIKKIIGFSFQDLCNHEINSFQHLVHPSDWPLLFKKRGEALRKKQVIQHVYRMQNKFGKYVWVKEVTKTLFDYRENVVCFEGFISKPVEPLKVDKVLRTYQAFKNAIHKSANVSIVDIYGKVIFVNKNYLTQSQYSKKELIGKAHPLLSFNHSNFLVEELWRNLKKGKSWKGEVKNFKKDGTYYWSSVLITPVFNEVKKIEQHLIIEHDITDKKNKEQQIINSNIALKESQRIAKLANWKFDFFSNEITFSEELYNILQLNPIEKFTCNTFLNLIHADDKEVIKTIISNFHQTQVSEIEFRVVVKNNILWLNATLQLELNEEKIPQFIYGVVIDFTDIKEKNVTIASSKNELKEILQNAPVIISKISSDFTIIYTNQENYFDKGKLVFQYILPNYHEVFKTKTKECLFSKKPVQVELQMQNFDGNINWYRVYIKKLFEPEDQDDISFIVIYQNITLEKNFNDEILKASTCSEEQERMRIATELHDGVCQNLVALKILYENFVKDHQSLFSEKVNAETVQNIRKLISTSLAEIRQCSYDLKPLDLYELGLFESLKSLVAISNSTGLMNFSLSINCIYEPKDYIAINVYRIVQEFIQNSLKHSEATEVCIRINENKNNLVFKLADNGKGFEKTDTKNSSMGLLSIMSRIKNIGGKYNLITNTGEGVQLFFSIQISL